MTPDQPNCGQSVTLTLGSTSSKMNSPGLPAGPQGDRKPLSREARSCFILVSYRRPDRAGEAGGKGSPNTQPPLQLQMPWGNCNVTLEMVRIFNHVKKNTQNKEKPFVPKKVC